MQGMASGFRRVGLVGRRVGITINPEHLKRDEEGFDDIDAFWTSSSESRSRATPKESETFLSPASHSSPSQLLSPVTHTSDAFSGALESPPGEGGEESDEDPSRTLRFPLSPERQSSVAVAVADRTPRATRTTLAVLSASSAATSLDPDDEGETEEEEPPDDSVGDDHSGGFEDSDHQDDWQAEGGEANQDAEESEEVDEVVTAKPVKEKGREKKEVNSRNKTIKGIARVRRRQDEDDSDGDDDDTDDRRGSERVEAEDEPAVVSESDGSGRKYSKRQRFPPLLFWKNERYVFERRNGGVGEVLPVVAGISERTKTPVAPKRAPKKVTAKRKVDEVEPFKDADIPQDHVIKSGEKGRVWNEKEQTIRKMRIVCRAEHMMTGLHDLPVTAKRATNEKSLVGKAAQAFFTPAMSSKVPGWISGYVVLPPKAIKDAEAVGECSQVFFVSECQPNSLEVALALPKEKHVNFDDSTAQRFLLGPGDQYFVPPHNVYRLENLSATSEAKINWVIIQPMQEPQSDAE